MNWISNFILLVFLKGAKFLSNGANPVILHEGAFLPPFRFFVINFVINPFTKRFLL